MAPDCRGFDGLRWPHRQPAMPIRTRSRLVVLEPLPFLELAEFRGCIMTLNVNFLSLRPFAFLGGLLPYLLAM